jgi:hypothetical protein
LVDKNCDGMNHNEWRHVHRKSQWFVRPNVWWFKFFFCCRLGLLSCVETSPQFYCFGVAISVDVKSVDSRPSPLWIYFHFLLTICVRAGTYNFFSLCSCSWTRFTRKKQIS